MPTTTYIITKDRQVRSQLSLLLRDLGYKPEFQEDISTLLGELRTKEISTTCFIGADIDLDSSLIKSLSEIRPRNTLIGFEPFHADREPKAYDAPEIFATTIILPSHPERAKSRIKSALHQTNTSRAIKRTATRPPFPRKSSIGSTLSPFGKPRPPSPMISDKARYLVCESAAARSLIGDLKKCAAEQSNILFVGDDEAEFELIARELNFLSNQDETPIEVVSGDDINTDFLEALERKAHAAKKPTIAYLGRVDDCSERAMRELGLFLEFLSNLRNPHLRIVIAYQKGSAQFFQAGVEELFPALRKQTEPLHVPKLAERPEDIRPICQILLASMRAAHPFLLVGRISDDAIKYIVDDRAQYSYAKLVRILRNSIALCQRSTLQVDNLKNYGESDMTTQHFLESMADEEYFPAEKSANF